MVDFKDELDDFWDVSKLVPKNKSKIGQFSTSRKVSDVIIDRVNPHEKKETSYYSDISQNEKKLDFSIYKTPISESQDKKIRTYAPKNNKLLKSITIKPSNDRFDFFDTFRKAALIYYDYKCPKSEFVSFYSYKPQYSQMTAEQKKYYFYWRDEVRNKRYLKTDYSYIYLYAYEILNLPEKIGKEEGLELLCNVWKAYRKELPLIDSYFALWIQDYCLVYELDPPFDMIREFLFDVITVSKFKEFYLSDTESGGNGAEAMIAYLSDYDWRQGKYAGGENAEMYRMHVEGSMQRIFATLLNNEVVSKSEISKITKTAFAGSLCTHTVKCILEIEYSSIADSPELRAGVTAALKYTENKLRACLGVKSRLSVKDLPEELKAVIDRYFEAEFKRLKREREIANEPAYERLYDAPSTNISFEDAVEIEKASWRMTAKLVEGSEDFEDFAELNESSKENDTFALLNVDENANDTPDSNFDTYGLTSLDIAILNSIYEKNDAEISRLLKENNVIFATVAEKINEAFADNFGDVILEENDFGKFNIIEDYNEEIAAWLYKIMK